MLSRPAASADMSGFFPEMVSKLPFMREFTIVGARLHGSIPDSVGTDWKHMAVLYLEFNRNLGGEMMSNWNGLRRNLRQLSLSHTALEGTIPSAVGSLHELNLLRLRNNRLGGTIPTSIVRLVNMESLNIGRNVLVSSLSLSLSRTTHNLTSYFFKTRCRPDLCLALIRNPQD